MIKDPPLLSIRRRFPRPSAEVVRAFKGVPTGHLVDAMGGRGCLPHTIRPLFPDKAEMVGVALTCHAGPADNLALFGTLGVAEAGDIMVAATDAFLRTAVTGDLLLGMARNQGMVGFVTDGLVRDIPGLDGVGMPVFCAGVCANSPARNGPGTVGVPIVIGDTPVRSGDILVGDGDGVVAVPREEAEDVLGRLVAIRAAEREFEAKVNAGMGLPDFMRAILASDRIEHLD
ncbi:MAG TPA: RraA family protein [Lichenihabitans sp.]|jgi:4-hydroxy-4-methyl-2-oxoglutarate aldolase|nr:RraA family protein [Lichenihabitans sp.]